MHVVAGFAWQFAPTPEKITGYSAEDFKEGAISFDRIHPDDLQRVIENFRNISESKSMDKFQS